MTDHETHDDLPTSDSTGLTPPRRPVEINLPPPPESIGPYRILEQLGAGTFGIVYLAERTKPVRMRVAIKVIRPGMASRSERARFEAERQALALMNHPNVATVHDVGATEDGRPYFVMELVAGRPITMYCDEHSLSIEARLELFIQACEGVQHAHQKGVIHRDLKPSNVLAASTDTGPTAKVIDFGIAKAISQPLTDEPAFTRRGQTIGTLEYMPPEQALRMADDIDTRADVYALGAMLYELLTGHLPFASGATDLELQRMIVEDDPPKPSVRLLSSETTAITKSRRCDERSLRRHLTGDLDWIVMKCLEKDRTRRYATATALAADLRRHLSNEPVVAGPPSARYRMRKFVRRNRAGVIAATTTVIALVGGMTGTTWAMLSAITARDAQAAAKADLEEVIEFQAAQLGDIDTFYMGIRIRQRILEQVRTAMEEQGATPEGIDERLTLLGEALAPVNFTDISTDTLDEHVFERALEAVDAQFGAESLIRARLLQELATTMRRAGLHERADGPQAEAVRVRQRLLSQEHPDTLMSVAQTGRLRYAQGRYEEALADTSSALEGLRVALGNDDLVTLESIGEMGVVLKTLGRLDEAEAYDREALHRKTDVLGPGHPRTLASLAEIGVLLEKRGRITEAERYYHEALEGYRAAFGDRHYDTLISMDNMGYFLLQQDRAEDAEPLIRDALKGFREVKGESHPDTLVAMGNLCVALSQMGHREESLTLTRRVVDLKRESLGDLNSSTLVSMDNLGIQLRKHGEYEDSERVLEDALRQCRIAFGDDHRDTLLAMTSLVFLYVDQGRFEEAAELGMETVSRARAELEPGHWQLGVHLRAHAAALAGLERFSEAEARGLESHRTLAETLGESHGRTVAAATQLAEFYDAWHESEPGSGHDLRAADWRARLEPTEPPAGGGG